MQLADYMRRHDLSDEAFARLIGPDFSEWTVRKWRYGQRVPRPEAQRRIAEITKGAVSPNDFINARPARLAEAG